MVAFYLPGPGISQPVVSCCPYCRFLPPKHTCCTAPLPPLARVLTVDTLLIKQRGGKIKGSTQASDSYVSPQLNDDPVDAGELIKCLQLNLAASVCTLPLWYLPLSFKTQACQAQQTDKRAAATIEYKAKMPPPYPPPQRLWRNWSADCSRPLFEPSVE